MYQNMMGSPGAPFGEQQVNDMGQQPMPAPRPMPMPNYRGYGFNPQPGGMPQPNPTDMRYRMGRPSGPMPGEPGWVGIPEWNMPQGPRGGWDMNGNWLGSMPEPPPPPPGGFDMRRLLGQPGGAVQPGGVDFSRLLGGGMSQYPGFGGAVQPGGMDYLRGRFGGGFTPMPDGGRLDNPYFGGGFNPQPDGGRVDNPDMQNPFRTFNNGNPFYNAKGNLRMRYRPGGQGDMRGNMANFWQTAPQPY